MKLREILKSLEVPLNREAPREIELEKSGGFNLRVLTKNSIPYQVIVEAMIAIIGVDHAEAKRRIDSASADGWCTIATYGMKRDAEVVASRLEKHVHQNSKFDNLKKSSGDRWNLKLEIVES